VTQDIDGALRGWDYQPGMIQPRLIETDNGRQVIQLRVDLGILQIETGSRPDGAKPHGFPTYFAYLLHQAGVAERAGHELVLSDEQCLEADREFVQFYHRRVCWLQLGNFGRAIADADHTLAFMSFVRDHSPNEEYAQAHEQYRGFVLFQRTQARVALEAEEKRPEAAIDALHAGLNELRSFFTEHGAEEEMEDNAMVQHLEQMEAKLREKYGIEATLQEQLDRAVADEDYEKAARLRDRLKRRQ
jgi:hypothetical protein